MMGCAEVASLRRGPPFLDSNKVMASGMSEDGVCGHLLGIKQGLSGKFPGRDVQT